MSETVAWVLPWAIVAVYVVWAIGYDRKLQKAKAGASE